LKGRKMRKHEQSFLVKKLEEIAEDVSRTPVHCGVKMKALQGIDDLIEMVEENSLKEEKPVEKPLDDFGFKMLKDGLLLCGENPKARKALQKTIRHHERLRKKAALQQA
jgi:hypothetical protein